jgi:hypothetical protein
MKLRFVAFSSHVETRGEDLIALRKNHARGVTY